MNGVRGMLLRLVAARRVEYERVEHMIRRSALHPDHHLSMAAFRWEPPLPNPRPRTPKLHTGDATPMSAGFRSLAAHSSDETRVWD